MLCCRYRSLLSRHCCRWLSKCWSTSTNSHVFQGLAAAARRKLLVYHHRSDIVQWRRDDNLTLLHLPEDQLQHLPRLQLLEVDTTQRGIPYEQEWRTKRIHPTALEKMAAMSLHSLQSEVFWSQRACTALQNWGRRLLTLPRFCRSRLQTVAFQWYISPEVLSIIAPLIGGGGFASGFIVLFQRGFACVLALPFTSWRFRLWVHSVISTAVSACVLKTFLPSLGWRFHRYFHRRFAACGSCIALFTSWRFPASGFIVLFQLACVLALPVISWRFCLWVHSVISTAVSACVLLLSWRLALSSGYFNGGFLLSVLALFRC
jgi:hypothetical protein